jgi:xanthine/CO dehydrogenase XdhC/CoxF family maturation factor
MTLCESGAVVGSVSGGCIEDDLDLLLINRTRRFPKKSINMENDGHESKQIQRIADLRPSAAS